MCMYHHLPIALTFGRYQSFVIISIFEEIIYV